MLCSLLLEVVSNALEEVMNGHHRALFHQLEEGFFPLLVGSAWWRGCLTSKKGLCYQLCFLLLSAESIDELENAGVAYPHHALEATVPGLHVIGIAWLAGVNEVRH